MRILLVEDERPLSAAIMKLLERRQFLVDPAYDGPIGLDLALTGDYDAMILDVMLPGMDGFAVLRAIRAKRSELPVLMLTARRCSSAGCFARWRKPSSNSVSSSGMQATS